MIAAPLLAAAMTRDPMQIAGLVMALQLPFLLFSLPGGAMVDRFGRRRLMIIFCLSRAIGLVALGACIAFDRVSVALLYPVAFLVGCSALIFDNASTAALPAIVRTGDLDRANGRLQAGKMLGQQLLAKPLGGWLFAAAAWSPFLLDAVALGVVAALSATLPATVESGRDAESRTTPRAVIGEGLRWLVRHRLLRALTITVSLSNVALGAMSALLVLIASERLGIGPVGFGVLQACLAVGGVIGGLMAGRTVAAIGPGTTMRAGLIIELLTYPALALTRQTVLVSAIMLVFGAHIVVFSAIGASLRQTLTPPHLFGRVYGAYRLIGNGGMFLGATISGAVAKIFGLVAPLWLGMATMLIGVGCMWRTLGNQRIAAAREAALTSH